MSFTSRRGWLDVGIAAGAQLFGALGTFLVMVTLVLALQRQGAGGGEVAALVTCEALPMVLLGKLIGHGVDRFDSRWVLVVSGAGQVAACLALAEALAQARPLPVLLAGAIVLSVSSGIAIAARQALLPAIVARDDLPKATAIGQSAGSAGMMFGPALAGFLVGSAGPTVPVRLAALGFVATIAAGLAIRTRRGGRGAMPAGVRQATIAAWQLRQDRLLWTSVWGMAGVMAALSAVNVVLVFFIMRTLGGTEQQYGLVDSMWTVGLLGGAWLFGRLIRPATSDASLVRWLFGVQGGISIAILAAGTVSNAVWIVPWYLLGGVQNGALTVIAGTLQGRRVPPHARGRASTATTMRIQAGALVGYVAGGLLLEVSQPRWLVVGCGAVGLLAVLAATPFVTRATPQDGEKVTSGVAFLPSSARPVDS